VFVLSRNSIYTVPYIPRLNLRCLRVVLTSVVAERLILTMKQADCLLFFGVSLEIASLLANRNVSINMLDIVPHSMYFTLFVLYFIKFYCQGFRLLSKTNVLSESNSSSEDQR